jgi:hypothetical protein
MLTAIQLEFYYVHYAERHYAKCCSSECHYAECRGLSRKPHSALNVCNTGQDGLISNLRSQASSQV